MISLCTVWLGKIKGFSDIFTESLLDKLELVSEVVIARPDQEAGTNATWREGKIRFIQFGCKQHLFLTDAAPGKCLDHGMAMQRAIERASNEYVYCSDPDIFFYTAVDRLYYELSQEYNLDIIGVSHPAAVTQCYGYFPGIMNLLIQKSKMPEKNFLKRRVWLHEVLQPKDFTVEFLPPNMPLDREYLIPSHLEGLVDEFPNPNGNFETGCYLYLWAKQNDWRWLAFQTADVHSYTTQYHRGSIGKVRIPKQKLFYHAVNCSIDSAQSKYEPFQRAYEQFKEEEQRA